MSLDHTVGPRRLRAAAVLIAAGLMVAACSPGSGTPNAPASGTAAPATTATAPSTAATTTGVTVPDAFTAVTVPRQRVDVSVPRFRREVPRRLRPGAHQRPPIPATSIRSTSSTPSTRQGPRLLLGHANSSAGLPPYGDCNRLRRLPSARRPAPHRGPRVPRTAHRLQRRLAAQAPKAVVHHLYGTGAAGPPAPGRRRLRLPRGAVRHSAGTPRVIGPPVKGENWVALNGCCDLGFPHRTSLNSLNGKLGNSQRFAIDWKQINAKARSTPATGPGTRATSTTAPPSTPSPTARSSGCSTSEEANAPGVLPAADPVLGAKLTIQNVDGNHIVQDIGGGVYAMYAHLMKGSLHGRSPARRSTRGRRSPNSATRATRTPRTCTSTS